MSIKLTLVGGGLKAALAAWVRMAIASHRLRLVLRRPGKNPEHRPGIWRVPGQFRVGFRLSGL